MNTFLALVLGVVIGLLPSILIFLRSYLDTKTPTRLLRKMRKLEYKVTTSFEELQQVIRDMKCLGLDIDSEWDIDEED